MLVSAVATVIERNMLLTVPAAQVPRLLRLVVHGSTKRNDASNLTNLA